MSDKRYPTRMHEVLGVEEKEIAIFKTPGLVDREFMLRNDVPHIRFVGDEHWKEMDGASLMRIVNHPERITRPRHRAGAVRVWGEGENMAIRPHEVHSCDN